MVQPVAEGWAAQESNLYAPISWRNIWELTWIHLEYRWYWLTCTLRPFSHVTPMLTRLRRYAVTLRVQSPTDVHELTVAVDGVLHRRGLSQVGVVAREHSLHTICRGVDKYLRSVPCWHEIPHPFVGLNLRVLFKMKKHPKVTDRNTPGKKNIVTMRTSGGQVRRTAKRPPWTYLEEPVGGPAPVGPVHDLTLLGQVLGRVDVRHHPLHCQESCQVGGVGRDHDESEEPPDTRYQSGGDGTRCYFTSYTQRNKNLDNLIVVRLCIPANVFDSLFA